MVKKQTRQSRRANAEEGATWKVPEVAHLMRVGDAAVRKMIAEGKLPAIYCGRNILVPKAAFLKFLETCGQVE